MIRGLLCAALVLLPTATVAQTRNQATAAGAAGVVTRLQSQGYGNIRDLRRMPDGSWTGKATRNGVPATVTANPNGTTIRR